MLQLMNFIGQGAGHLLDMEVYTTKGLASAGHKAIFWANFDIVQQFPMTDCIILPDFSPEAVRGLFQLVYDPNHR